MRCVLRKFQITLKGKFALNREPQIFNISRGWVSKKYFGYYLDTSAYRSRVESTSVNTTYYSFNPPPPDNVFHSIGI